MARSDPDPRENLLSFLQAEATRATDTTLQDQRALAISYYKGEPYGDEVEGRSQLRTRDVAEVVDQQVISVLRTMVSGDHVVEFDGEGEDGTDYGLEATEAVQYQFMRKQNGYRVLHDSLKAGLLEKTGLVKSWPCKKFKMETVELIEDDMAFIEPANIVEADQLPDREGVDEMGFPVLETWWKVKHRVELPVQFRDMAVPNEEFEIAPDARSLDGPEYKAHVCQKSLSELIEMGFDVDAVKSLWGDQPSSTVLSNARDASSIQSQDVGSIRPGVQRKVWLREEYVAYDDDGDGYSELLRTFRVGTTILEVEEVDENPFSGWTPFPMQHRFIGDSSADKTMDIQVTRSAMLRQAMDNLYLTNRPRMAVDESTSTEDTLSDTLSVVIGGVIRHRGGAPMPVTIPFAANHAFEAMEVMLGEREQRTGVTRHNQGLQADSISHNTVGGMQMLQANSDAVQEYIARNFAEELVAPMFAKRYRLMRKFGQPFQMKIEGKKVTVDPTLWPEEIDVTINVGLGTGRKDQRLAYRAQLLDFQKDAVAAGSPLVDPEKVFNNVKGMIRDAALGTPTDYINDPAELPPQEEKPDPAALEVQAKAMIEAEKLQGENAEKERQAELKRQSLQYDYDLRLVAANADADVKRQAAELDAQLRRDKAIEESRLAEQKMAFEMDMAVRKFDFEKTLAKQKASAASEDDSLPTYRAGGDLAE